jgi:peptide/nickel transport system permease protein
MDLAPGDVATAIAGNEANPELLAEIRRDLHLDDSVFVRYGRWLEDLATGDLGTSLVTKQKVGTVITNALPATLSLVVVAVFFSITISLCAGVACTWRPNGLVDRVIVSISSLGIAMPTFFTGLLLVANFSIKRRWFPAVGYVPPGDGVGDWLRHLVLPGLALSGVTIAELTRQLRGSLQDALGEDYTLAAVARGVGRFRLICKHALKNAAIPVVTVMGIRLAAMLGGAVIVERVFAIRGLGTLIIEAVQSKDLPVLLGIVVLYTIIVVVVNLLVDLSYTYLNPRLARD